MAAAGDDRAMMVTWNGDGTCETAERRMNNKGVGNYR